MQCPAASVSDLLGELIFGNASGVSPRKATNAAETARNAFISCAEERIKKQLPRLASIGPDDHCVRAS